MSTPSPFSTAIAISPRLAGLALDPRTSSKIDAPLPAPITEAAQD
ncbi:hypothetical protein [Verrucomicrobium spinosum]